MKTKTLRNTFFTLALCLLSLNGIGQTIKIQAGTSISKLDWRLHGLNVNPAFEDNLIGYSFFVGVDYLEKPYFNLTGHAGLIRRGGKGDIMLTNLNGDSLGTRTVRPTLDYFSINTILELNRQLWEMVTPFVSFGPRFDYLISYSEQFDILESNDSLEKFAYGLIFGGGLKYNPSILQIGIRADYYMDFTKVAEWNSESGIGGEVTNNTFTVHLFFGYSF